jgi:hypothetical protein
MYHLSLQHIRRDEWEELLRVLRHAMHASQSVPMFPTSLHFHFRGEIGTAYRMMGRYELASEMSEQAIQATSMSRERVQLTGKLATVYSHLNRLDDAKRVCEDGYNNSKSPNLDYQKCRFVGNLGMISYQLYLLNHDANLLDIAMGQLQERIDLARQLKNLAARNDEKYSFYTAKGLLDSASNAALDALNITSRHKDSTQTAFSRFFYGRALFLAGRAPEALEQFNNSGTCPPLIALCREPADEDRGYIREMISVGADIELRDEDGYSALDCVVYNGDNLTKEVIERGLRTKFTSEVESSLEQQRHEAIVRKGYRDFFQDKLRPVFMYSERDSVLQKLRHIYAKTLASDAEKTQMFDPMRFVRYLDFLSCGRLP